MFFHKNHITSNASRFFFKYLFYFFRKNNFKKLTTKFKSKSGRNHQGQIVCFTRSKLIQKKKINKINYFINFFFKPGLILYFHINSYKNKLLMLMFWPNGIWMYRLTFKNLKLFHYLFLDFFFKLKKFWLKTNFFFLIQFKQNQLISNLTLNYVSKIKYMRSNGAKGKILNKNVIDNKIIILLPSKFKKIFKIYSLAVSYSMTLNINKKIKCNKSGYWRNLGKKSMVRGVAMNPVDHPHGGRTKSIKLAKTPWGKNTK